MEPQLPRWQLMAPTAKMAAKQRRQASTTAAGPCTIKKLASCPATLAPGRSSASAELLGRTDPQQPLAPPLASTPSHPITEGNLHAPDRTVKSLHLAADSILHCP